MLEYVLCKSCGRCLGNINDLFMKMRNDAISKELNAGQNADINAVMVPFADDINIDMGDIYKKLHINNECCMNSLIANVTFRSVYN